MKGGSLPITQSDVAKLRATAQLGLPLEIAALASEIDPETAQRWIEVGRAVIRQGRGHGNLNEQERLCAEVAKGWDPGLAKLIVMLQGYQLAHAKKDPAICKQMLEAAQDEHSRRKTRREQAGLRARNLDLSKDNQIPMVGTPLANVGMSDDGEYFEGRSTEDLEYYALHGRYPDEEPKPIVIDVDAEELEMDNPDLAAELGTPGAAEEIDLARQNLNVLPNGLVEMPNGQSEHVQTVTQPRVVNQAAPVPAAPPLRVVDRGGR